MRIELTDNNIKCENNIYSRNDIASLFPIADKTIDKLCKDNENLLIFPHSIRESDDRIGSASILNIISTSEPNNVRIMTNNIMGFIGIGNMQIKIKSRFDNGRDDYFLHYMLQKVMSFNLFDLKHNNEQEDIFDFIMFLFPYYLKNAIRQGMYREYKSFKHNDSNIKGTIDLNRHVCRNIPFNGNVAYTTREYAYDNDMTQLIRHTIEFMMSKQYGNVILNIDRETISNVKYITEHTSSYNKSERSKIISRNLRFKSHPYFSEYRPLQSLCLQILRMEEIKYGYDSDEICGVLFDGAWLWEEYLNTILKEQGFIHPENKLSKGRIYLFEDTNEQGKKKTSGYRYPDFYKENIVLDAKYKRLGSYEKVSKVDNNDIHQLITYMNNLKATHGGFIAPLEKSNTTRPSSHLKGSKSEISIYGIEICKEAESYADFAEIMKQNEAEFIKSINVTLSDSN